MKIGTKVKFEAAHRQLGDTSKCGFIHGHNWVVEIEVVADKLDKIGYVVDFKKLKDAITNILDHKIILNTEDPLVQVLEDNHQQVLSIIGNPTCEVLIMFIKKIILATIPQSAEVRLITLRLFENDDSYAEVIFP